MRPIAVVVFSPTLDSNLSFSQCDEPVLVQTLISKLPIEALDIGILDRFSWPDVIELDALFERPRINCFAGELRPVIPTNAGGHGLLFLS